MSITISNDNILSPNDGRTAASEQRNSEQMPTRSREKESATPKSSKTATNPVSVDRASQLYSQSVVASSSHSEITTPQQAAVVAKEISQQFSADAEQAIRSQSGQTSVSLAALLEAAPV